MVAATNANAWRSDLIEGKHGPVKCMTNTVLYLENLTKFAGQFRFNQLSCLVELAGRPLQDTDYVDIRIVIENAGYIPEKSDLPLAVERVARNRSYHPIQDYLGAQVWDEQPRLDTWLSNYLGAEDHPLMRSFASKFLIGAVARVFEPGCKMDNMLVFEGPQGLGKTTAVGALFGEQYMTSGIEDFGNKDAAIGIEGRWVVELAELAALNKSDVLKAKKWITETADQYRPPYGRHTVRRPRQIVIIGTTNDSNYLKDTTGNRRYWPVPVKAIDIPGVRQARDQIWAEAVHRYRHGEEWWLDAHDTVQAAAVQRDRIEEDVWAGDLDVLLAEPEVIALGYVTVPALLAGLNLTVDRRGKAQEMRVAQHLASRGYSRIKMRVNGKPSNVWKRG